MAALAGILNHPSLTAGQALSGAGASPMAAATSSSSSSSSSSATISANDFLTLLVTEMKNQDPTANADPNQYIDQLVNVNSLQQLIGINQTLTTRLGSATSSGTGGSSSGTSGQVAATASSLTGLSAAGTPASGTTASLSGVEQMPAHGFAPGNLGIPGGNPSANRVANALNGLH